MKNNQYTPVKNYTRNFLLPQGVVDYFELIRVNNLLILVFTIITAFFLSDSNFEPLYKTMVFLSACLIFAGGNVLNDYFDLTIDIINSPDRPLPSGRISPNYAKNIGIALLLSGVFLTYFLKRFHLIWASVSALLLFLYDAQLKKRLLVGNLIVAFLCGFIFIYAGGPPVNGALIFAALFAFLVHFAREIIKDIVDMPGDVILGARTIPISWGTKTARVIIAVDLILLLGILFVPYLIGLFGVAYLFLNLFSIVPLLLIVLLEIMFGKPKPQKFRLLSLILKIAMILGIVALIAGRWWK